jgi:hypothetical protein
MWLAMSCVMTMNVQAANKTVKVVLDMSSNAVTELGCTFKKSTGLGHSLSINTIELGKGESADITCQFLPIIDSANMFKVWVTKYNNQFRISLSKHEGTDGYTNNDIAPKLNAEKTTGLNVENGSYNNSTKKWAYTCNDTDELKNQCTLWIDELADDYCKIKDSFRCLKACENDSSTSCQGCTFLIIWTVTDRVLR